MKANTLISLQLTSIIVMAGTATMLFNSAIATILFLLSFFIFIRCSIYIERNKKRLLKECKRGG